MLECFTQQGISPCYVTPPVCMATDFQVTAATVVTDVILVTKVI